MPCRAGVFIVNAEHVSHSVSVVDFGKVNVSWVALVWCFLPHRQMQDQQESMIATFCWKKILQWLIVFEGGLQVCENDE